MMEKSEALLPVISANMCGRSGLYKYADALLDSGAQISLIHQETAEMLGLEGQNVSITKIGGEEEKLRTKVFKFQVTALDIKKTFSVKAIGIPRIIDNVVDIRTRDITGVLDLKDKNIHRGKGAVDILIGIDPAHMHTGEKRQAGHLVARNSPLGWVVFGTSTGGFNEVNQILHVTYAMPSDLSDFWTTETMGVAVTPCLCAADKRSQSVERGEAKIIESSCQKGWKPVDGLVPTEKRPCSFAR